MNRRTRTVATLGLCLAIGLTACGDDDGAGVRDITPTEESAAETGSAAESGSATASAPAEASEPASGSASGVAHGGEDAPCVPVGDATTATATVELHLTEYAIVAQPPSITAGTIRFVAENKGAHHHEVVVVRADTIAELPTLDEGSFDEAGAPAGSVIGEIEAFGAQQSCDGTFELTPGTYVLLCNLVDIESDALTAHFSNGMSTTFTVSA